MAYSNESWLVQIRGNLGDAEVWSNTWCVEVDSVDPAFNDVRDAFHDFYDTLATGGSSVFGEEWNAVSMTRRNLLTGSSVDPTWATITGTNGNDMLPYECAVRISLTDGFGVNGGPFLAGFTVESVTASGLLKTAYQNVIHDALQQLDDDLDAVDATLCMNSPTSEATLPVFTARVGQVFDVIRRRRNQLLEAYVSVDFSA